MQNLVTAVQQAGPDQARLQAVLDTLKANDSRLAKLVTDNTQAQSPEPTPDPVVPPSDPAANQE